MVGLLSCTIGVMVNIREAIEQILRANSLDDVVSNLLTEGYKPYVSAYNDLFEIHNPSTQEQMAVDNLKRNPGNSRNWKPVFYLASRRIPETTSNRNYIQITFKRPKTTVISIDGPISIPFMTVKRCVVTGVDDSGDKLKLEILNWTRTPFPRGSGVFQLDAKTGREIESIDVIDLPKAKVEALKYNAPQVKAKVAPSYVADEEEEEEETNDATKLLQTRLKLGRRGLQRQGFMKVLALLPKTGSYGQKIPGGGNWVKVHEWNSAVDDNLFTHGGKDEDADYDEYWLCAEQHGARHYYFLVDGQDESDAIQAWEEEWPERVEDHIDDPDNEEHPVSWLVEVLDFALAKRLPNGDYETLDGQIIKWHRIE